MAYDIAELEQALINADKAGDSAAANMLAREIRKARSASSVGSKSSALGRPEDTLQVFNPFGSNFDTGIPIGADISNTLAGYGKAIYDVGRGAGQMVNLVGSQEEADARKRDKELMSTKAGFTGNILGNVGIAAPAAFIPGANTVYGAGLIGGGLGALQPTVEGEDRFKNAATSAALGVGGFGIGKAIGKGISAASNKMAGLELKVAEKAAKDAASQTASARSLAGREAQNAYRQIENLRDLKAAGLLSPEKRAIYDKLSKELAEKSADNLASAAASKESAAAAFVKAIDDEPAIAAKLAAERLSGGEAKNQILARLKRYGPGAAVGAIGGALFGGPGAIAGVPIGLYLRPAFHSIARMAKNPAVQYHMLRPFANAGLLADATNPRMLGLLAPSIYAAQE